MVLLNPDPTIVTTEPTGPDEGEKEEITGCENACTWKRQNSRIKNLFIYTQNSFYHNNFGHNNLQKFVNFYLGVFHPMFEALFQLTVKVMVCPEQ